MLLFVIINYNKLKWEDMKTTLKIVMIGNSKGVIIPAYILKKLKIDIDDLVEIDIKKINGN